MLESDLSLSLSHHLLPVLFTVGPLRGLESAGGVTLEVLPQAGTRGEPLAAGLALVRLVASVDPLVVDQVPLGLKQGMFSNANPGSLFLSLTRNVFPQSRHWKGLSPVCFLMWTFRSYSFTKLWPQS